MLMTAKLETVWNAFEHIGRIRCKGRHIVIDMGDSRLVSYTRFPSHCSLGLIPSSYDELTV